jgi:hypothetical protein
MHLSVRPLASSVVLALLLASCGQSTAPTETTSTTTTVAELSAETRAALQTQLLQLQARVQQVQDANAIKRLQRAYGYYMEEGMWDEVANLFAESGSIELARDGVYQGKARVQEYLMTLGGGQLGLREGQLNEQLQVMPVVTVAADGQSAKARWRNILLVGELGKHAEIGEGPFENEYIKENGVWKFSKVRWQQAILVPYKGGWAANEDYNKGLWVSDKLPPDAPPTDDHGYWPETYLPPFHFSNPVATYVAPEAGGTPKPTAPVAPSVAAVTASASARSRERN